ncbi:mucin-5AC-like [Helianthus annuus]|uniref:mucin-5AC-like n=1 Tax=Helianthus annuus TaxID=4232 RepID=UPI000B904E18|nr:mucin-5AC-like [Helianthus annuus]
MAVGAITSAVAVGFSVPAGGVAVTSATAELVSPTHALKKRKVITPLTSFQAIQTAYALPTSSTAEVQIESVSSAPLTYVDVMPSATSEPSLSELISQASATAATSSMPPPVLTAAVAVTTSPVSTPLPSSVTPTSLFDSPLSIFSASEKEMPKVSAAHEATSARDTAVSDARGSSSGIVDDGARLGNDLYLPTINWDPNVQDKRYQPKWKVAESGQD